ncbi:MAG: hypothetical protein WCK02_16360 [Bacteroidota bacterium]
MNIKGLILFILLLSTKPSESVIYISQINFSDFYRAFASSDLKLVDNQLNSLSKLDNTSAYFGALLMKKSALVTPKDKLAMFAKGKKILEESIKKSPENAEYRFLRLVVQENCPPILDYKKNIKTDAAKIRENFKQFSPELKSAVVDYSKISKALNIKDLI